MMRYAWVWGVVVLAGCASSEPKSGSKADQLVDQLTGMVVTPPKTPDDAWKKKEAEMERLYVEVMKEAATPAGKAAVNDALRRNLKAARAVKSSDSDHKIWMLLDAVEAKEIALDPSLVDLVQDYRLKPAEEMGKKAEAQLRERAKTADGKRKVLQVVDDGIEYFETKNRIDGEGKHDSQIKPLKDLKKSIP